MNLKQSVLVLLIAGLLATSAQAQPNLGFAQVQQGGKGTTTLFYPTQAAESTVQMGPFTLEWANDGSPAQFNGRLIVISHGSGGSPWVSVDLARALVRRGFVVVLPQHQGDNHLEGGEPGPDSWKRRPHEISSAIDLALDHPLLKDRLQPDAVGVYGGSAGGHTALSMAGGVWSPARFRDHCMAHLEADFSSCVGFFTRLNGDWLDGPKRWLARWVIRLRFSDTTDQKHHDPRVRAVVAMVPFAADFDTVSLASPRVPLGLITAGQDVNQVPRFHVEAVKAACLPRCTDLLTLPEAGHGAMLSPMPPLEPGGIAHQLLADPPGFDRATAVPLINARIVEFFAQHLGVP